MWKKLRRSSIAHDSGNSPPASPTSPSTSPTSRFKSPTWISGALPSSKRPTTSADDNIKQLFGSQPSSASRAKPSTRDTTTSASKTPISLLTSLPTEIILLILTYMDDRSLFALSQLCRAFNELALCEALSRPQHGSLSINDLTGHQHNYTKDTKDASQPQLGHGEEEWEDSSCDNDVVHIQAHTIRYLRMALFVRGIRKLDLTFSAMEVMHARLGDMARLRDLIERMNESLSTDENTGGTVVRGAGAMDELIIDFSEDLLRPTNLNTPRQSRKPVCTGFTSLLSTCAGHMDTPAVVVVTCLGIFTTKVSMIPNWKLHKGCYDVERFDAAYVTAHDGALRIAPMIPSVVAVRICNVPKSTWAATLGQVRDGDSGGSSSSSSSKPPLAPPTYSWTIVTIDPFLINHLDLSIDSLSTSEWSILLHTLDLPNLTEVSIWSKAISPVDSALFLNRHQTITVLHHSSQIPFHFSSSSFRGRSGGEDMYCPRVVLPHLERLNARPPYITYILTPPQLDPNSTTTTGAASPEANPQDLFRSLHTIRIGGVAKEAAHTIYEALNAIARVNRHANNTGGDGVLNLSFSSIHPSTLERLLSLDPSPPSILNVITLTLLDWPIPPPPHTPSTWFSLPLFIHLFPHLQKLCISGSLPGEVNLRDHMKWRRDLVRSIWEVCPWVERYVIDRMEGSTEWWMHGVRSGTGGS